MPLLMQTEDLNKETSSYFISVIVAIKDEQIYIRKCLDSLIKQTLSKDLYHIIVVDGGSTDKTLLIVEEYLKKFPTFITLYHNPKQWQSAGRNIAISNCEKSDLVAYLDGHCMADPKWLESLLKSYLESKSDSLAGIGSIHRSPEDESKIGKVIDQIFCSPFGGMGTSYQPQKTKKLVQTAPFVLYSKKAVQHVGCYDEEMKIGEDFTLNYKLRKNNYSLFIEPNAVVYYYKKQRCTDFLKQMFNYGYAKSIIAKKYPFSLSFFQYLPSFCLIGILIGIILGLFVSMIGLIVSALLICYIAILFSYAIHITIKKKKHFYCYLMPWMFIMQHVGYSIGFLHGLFRKGWKM